MSSPNDVLFEQIKGAVPIPAPPNLETLTISTVGWVRSHFPEVEAYKFKADTGMAYGMTAGYMLAVACGIWADPVLTGQFTSEEIAVARRFREICQAKVNALKTQKSTFTQLFTLVKQNE